MEKDKTISYYNSNAKEFVFGTVSVDFEFIQNKFTDKLPEKSVILDFVKHMFFNELTQVEKYEGIWACSSILHLPLNELVEVMRKMVTALKGNGIIYTSFKYGTFAGERNGRYFTDMTEDTFADFIKQIENIRV